MATGETKAKVRKRPKAIRLNLGCGEAKLPGYTNLDKRQAPDQEAYPLNVKPGSITEIRASHLLEHFSHKDTQAVLGDWHKALKPGGIIKIAVPDIDAIVDMYRGPCADQPIEGWLMGDQIGPDSTHKAIFNNAKLRMLLKSAGFVRVKHWRSRHQDSADSPISLNLQGTKPKKPAARQASMLPLNIAACMSMPRLSFTENYFSAFQALMPDKVPLRKFTGAFWGQCLTNCIEESLKEFPDLDAILTIDYDTIFSRDDVLELVRLLAENPEADAIASLQSHRTKPTPLMTMNDAKGRRVSAVTTDTFYPDLTAVATAHFGLTLIRVPKLLALPRPWFISKPNRDGQWHEGRTDEDIHFWRHWIKNGNTLYMANRVPVGHAELMVRWPGKDLMAIYQHPSDWCDSGKPTGVWT